MNKAWFVKLSPGARQEYLRQHPRSKLRGKSSSKSNMLRPGVTKMKVKRPRPVTSDVDGDEGLF